VTSALEVIFYNEMRYINLRFTLLYLLYTVKLKIPDACQVFQVSGRNVRAPSYLADELKYTADFEARGRLCSSSSLSLNVRRLSTVSDQTFPVATVRTCNSLSQHVTFTPSMSVF